MKTAVIYTRVSTTEQRDNTSLHSQLSDCRSYADRNGYTILGEYVDAHTGTEYNRPQLDTMKEAIRAGGVNAVICYNPDRWSRDIADALLLIGFLEPYQTELLFVNAPSPDSPENNLQLQMLFAFAEYEKEKILGRLNRGKREKVASGSIHSNSKTAPYGYDYIRKPNPNGRGTIGKLVINEAEARVVKQLYEWIAYEGIATYEAAKRLYEAGIPTKRGGMWFRETVRHMVGNSIYKGVYVYGKTTGVKPKNPKPDYSDNVAKPRTPKRAKSSRKRTDPSQWIEVPCPAIVTPELWQAVSDRIQRNKDVSARNTKYFKLLQSLVYCGVCGRRMNLRAPHGRCKQTKYRCPNKPQFMRFEERCWVKEIFESVVNSAVWDGTDEVPGIYKRLQNPKLIREGIERQAQNSEKERTRDEETLHTIMAALLKLDRDEQKLIDLYLQDILPQESLRPRLDELRKNRTRVEKERIELQTRVEARTHSQQNLEALEGLAESVRSGLGVLSPEEKREILEALDTRVTIYKDGSIGVECLITDGVVVLLQATATNKGRGNGPGSDPENCSRLRNNALPGDLLEHRL